MQSIRQRIETRRAEGWACEVRGCYRPAYKLSRLCKEHDKNEQRTGHPLGRTIRKCQLRPYTKPIAEFIRRHREHPGIRAALEWIGREIAEAKAPDSIHARSTPEQRLARWLERMRIEAVAPEEVLTTVAAVYLHERCDERFYKSGRHFRHQLAIRALRLVPARFIEASGGGHSWRIYDRVTVGVRELLGKRLMTVLGPMAGRIAREVHAEMERRGREAAARDRIDGWDAPFDRYDNSNHSTDETTSDTRS